MALHRGIQSAIFYYVSCAPCAEARVRKQRKAEAKRDRLERLALEAEMPHLYRHPSPSSTNPHWQTEIMLGPTPSARGTKRKPNPNVAGRSNASGVPSTVSLPPGSASTRHDSKVNLRLQQREDEELWGAGTNLDGAYTSTSPESIRRPPRALTRDAAMADFKSFRNPSINDLHPATVTRVTKREEVMWMMQPPPVAEVMSGKESLASGRSDGGASRRRTPNVTPLSRPVSDRTVDGMYGSGSPPTLGLSRESSSRASNRVPSQRHDRGGSPLERDFAFAPSAQPRQGASRTSSIRDQRSPQLQPIDLGPPTSLAPSASLRRHPSHSTKTAPVRPPLSAIASESLLSTASTPSGLDAQTFYTPAETPSDLRSADPFDHGQTPTQEKPSPFGTADATPRTKTTATALLVRPDNRLRVLHAGRENSKHASPGTPRLHRVRSHDPSQQASDGNDSFAADDETRDGNTGSIFASWGTPGFEPSQWILEHTKREGVRERWSMDL